MLFFLAALVSFLCAFVGSVPLAGPIAVLVVSRAARGEGRGAFAIAVGAAVSEALYAGCAFWGLSALVARHPVLLSVSRAVSAVLLVALGLYFVRWKEDGRPSRAPEAGARPTFWLGLSVSLFNPTLLVTWGAVVAFVCGRGLLPARGALAFPFGLGAFAGVTAWNAILVRLIARFRDRFPRAAFLWTVRAMGAVIAASGIGSAVELARDLRRAVHACSPSPTRVVADDRARTRPAMR